MKGIKASVKPRVTFLHVFLPVFLIYYGLKYYLNCTFQSAYLAFVFLRNLQLCTSTYTHSHNRTCLHTFCTVLNADLAVTEPKVPLPCNVRSHAGMRIHFIYFDTRGKFLAVSMDVYECVLAVQMANVIWMQNFPCLYIINFNVALLQLGVLAMDPFRRCSNCQKIVATVASAVAAVPCCCFSQPLQQFQLAVAVANNAERSVCNWACK